MAGPTPNAAPAAAPLPNVNPDPVVNVNDAAAWSSDYYNRRAAQQLFALQALQIAAGALMGA